MHRKLLSRFITSALVACSSSTTTSAVPDAAAPPAEAGRAPMPTVDVPFESPDTTLEAEPHLAVTPGGSVAVAWIGIGKPSRIGYARSRDHGDSFGAVQSARGPTGESADPVLAAGVNEDLWLAWLGFVDGGTAANSHIWVARAAAGGEVFGDAIDVSDHTGVADKPSIVVTQAGTVVVTYLNDTGLMAATSTDGAAWKRTKVIDEAGKYVNHLPSLCATGKRTYLAHMRYGYQQITGPRQVMLRASEDEGATWSPGNVTQVSAPEETDAVFLDVPCVARGNEVWVLYGRSRDKPSGNHFGTAYALRVAHSSDGGRTIDNRFDVHDPAAGSVFLNAHLAGVDGALYLAYYAGGSSGDPDGTLRLARSTDGLTFAPSTVVRSPVALEGSRASRKWIGDYIGLAAGSGNVYLAYTDNSGTASHVRFHRTPAR